MSAPVAAAPPAAPPPKPAAAKPRPATPDITKESLDRLWRRVSYLSIVIIVLTFVLVFEIPFTRPVFMYYSLSPAQKTARMVGLGMPNMTNRAILAWSTTSITEVMTMGFGDINIRMPKQRGRFTVRGWEAYQRALEQQEIAESFRRHQLVLTTVPSNTPVITGQGVNVDGAYQWLVQMPVVMTYATNNNVTKKENRVVSLTITRVDAEENSAGIAIHSWQVL